MLKLCYSINDLDFRQLMDVYEESNQKSGQEYYPKETENLQILFAEQDFYQYLELFFQFSAARYAVWVAEGSYKAAARLEEYGDGLLITALETLPAARGRGYATELLQAVQEHLKGSEQLPVYSHIQKLNHASLAVHQKCGFLISSQCAQFLDGSWHDDHYTLIWKN